MAEFTFDVKAFLTLHITAEDEASARAFIDELVSCAEGNGGSDGGVRGYINSASQDGEADLVEVDGEDPDAEDPE